MLNIIFTILLRLFACIVYGIAIYVGLGYCLLHYILSGRLSPEDFGPRSRLIIIGWFAVNISLLYLIF